MDTKMNMQTEQFEILLLKSKLKRSSKWGAYSFYPGVNNWGDSGTEIQEEKFLPFRIDFRS